LRKIVIAATAAIFVTACSNDAAPAAKPQEDTPTVLKGGEYEGSWKVASVQSVDRSTPATKLKQDASGSAQGCVTADGTIENPWVLSARWIPGVDPSAVTATTCLYTSTPNGHFVIDRDGPITVAAGFSGHGFKFCSVVGEIMADLAIDGGTRWDVELFRLSRFDQSRGSARF